MSLVIIPIVAVGAWGLLVLGRRLITNGNGTFTTRNLKYQSASAGLATVGVAVSWLVSGNSPLRWSGLGDMNAPTPDMAWLGIGPTDGWITAGSTFLIVMTVVTGITLWFQVGRRSGITGRHVVAVLPIVLVVAVINAAVEEALFRLTLVTALTDIYPLWGIALISAVLFGIPHFFGKPGGVPGIAMAGFMAWFATFSIVQTGGMGWAITIHFVQDIVILVLVFARERVGGPVHTA